MNWLQVLIDSIAYLWPLKIVEQWERGIYYVFGIARWEVGPGCWPFIPFFMRVVSEGTVTQTFVTPLQSITTKDGGTITFSATVKLRVVSVKKSLNNVLNYDETALEDIAAALADKLADVDASQLDLEKRRTLIANCKRVIDKELEEYGLETSSLRFNNFVRNMKVYRLFNDQAYTSH